MPRAPSLIASKLQRNMASRKAGFSPDVGTGTTVSLWCSVSARPRSHKKQILPAGRSIAAASSSSARLFNYVRSNLARAIRLVSSSKKRRKPASAKGSSNTVVPQQFIPHRDSHHSEALEDCIEFINSSYRKSI